MHTLIGYVTGVRMKPSIGPRICRVTPASGGGFIPVRGPWKSMWAAIDAGSYRRAFVHGIFLAADLTLGGGVILKVGRVVVRGGGRLLIKAGVRAAGREGTPSAASNALKSGPSAAGQLTEYKVSLQSIKTALNAPATTRLGRWFKYWQDLETKVTWDVTEGVVRRFSRPRIHNPNPKWTAAWIDGQVHEYVHIFMNGIPLWKDLGNHWLFHGIRYIDELVAWSAARIATGRLHALPMAWKHGWQSLPPSAKFGAAWNGILVGAIALWWGMKR